MIFRGRTQFGPAVVVATLAVTPVFADDQQRSRPVRITLPQSYLCCKTRNTGARRRMGSIRAKPSTKVRTRKGIDMHAKKYAMTESEIASELGISKAAVKNILHRALAKIRARPEFYARLRVAVEEKRRARDARWISRTASGPIQ